MINVAEIRHNMEVVGSDGGHVGRVGAVQTDEIELARFDLGSGLRAHAIPITWVETIQDGKLCLLLTRDEAKAAWRETH